MFFAIAIIIVVFLIVGGITEHKYKELEAEVLKVLGFSGWDMIPYMDETIRVKSRQTLDKYDDIKFFKENKEKLRQAENILKRKDEIASILRTFLADNPYKSYSQYDRLTKQIDEVLKNTGAYRIVCSVYIISWK